MRQSSDRTRAHRQRLSLTASSRTEQLFSPHEQGPQGQEPGREPIRTRDVAWPAIILTVVAASVIILFLAWAQGTTLVRGLIGRSDAANNTLFYVILSGCMAALLFGAAKLRPTDVGLRADKLRQGAIVTVVIWLVIQASVVISEFLTVGPPTLAKHWTSPGIVPTLTWFVIMLLGAGLFEETLCRGFLFPQLYLRLPGSHRVRFWMALLASQFLFAISHIPAHVLVRHWTGRMLMMQLIAQGIAGVMLVFIYLRTRNLWIAIGFHAIANAPTGLFAASMGWEPYAVAVIIGWPWLARKPQHRGFAAIERMPDHDAPLTS